ncbi:MAG: DUF488 family protein [Methanotrichaceae archaeon]|nr:DUF488 family protein [Methanotrichaceae archaeon]
MLRVKRVYDAKSASDGKRIYADRLWPRGLSKKDAPFDEWFKELSPSDELRKWFHHEEDKFPEFKKRYLRELSTPEKQDTLKRIAKMANQGDVTLVYSARDREQNNAVVLAELISELTKEKMPAQR